MPELRACNNRDNSSNDLLTTPLPFGILTAFEGQTAPHGKQNGERTMYSETYMRQMEQTGLTAIIEAAARYGDGLQNERLSACRKPSCKGRTLELAADHSVPLPPEALERAEEGTAFDAILRQATSADERVLMRLIGGLLDDVWRFGTGKELRGELRRRFVSNGCSTRRFYTAFHGIERLVAECR